jgi:high affinity Mn2+ porin
MVFSGSKHKVLLVWIFCCLTLSAWAEGTEAQDPSPYSLHFQSTVISQYHGSFPAAYSGPFSLNSNSEIATSFTATFFLGVQVWDGGSLYYNPEVPAGTGFSGVSGLGDFSNGEISKVGSASPTYNTARLYAQQVFGLGGEQEKIEDDQNQVAAKMDVSRVTLTAGKFALNDFFDNNAYAHDARTQFINLTFIDDLAWDFAADTHGYTLGVVAELNQKSWAFRAAGVLVSTVANGPDYDWNLANARSENVELEWRYGSDNGAGKLRLLGYVNSADMGNYQTALNQAPVNPSVVSTRTYEDKYGLGLGWEQAAGEDLGFFGRLGWNNGTTESWEFVAVDQNASLGAALKGGRWGRPEDQLGLGVAASGLSAVHQAYLAAGGVDFNIGDGALRYGPEEVVELYYLYKPFKFMGLTLDLQGINHPGYNQDRGPVGIVSGRAHVEI